MVKEYRKKKTHERQHEKEEKGKQIWISGREKRKDWRETEKYKSRKNKSISNNTYVTEYNGGVPNQFCLMTILYLQ